MFTGAELDESVSILNALLVVGVVITVAFTLYRVSKLAASGVASEYDPYGFDPD